MKYSQGQALTRTSQVHLPLCAWKSPPASPSCCQPQEKRDETMQAVPKESSRGGAGCHPAWGSQAARGSDSCVGIQATPRKREAGSGQPGWSIAEPQHVHAVARPFFPNMPVEGALIRSEYTHVQATGKCAAQRYLAHKYLQEVTLLYSCWYVSAASSHDHRPLLCSSSSIGTQAGAQGSAAGTI